MERLSGSAIRTACEELLSDPRLPALVCFLRLREMLLAWPAGPRSVLFKAADLCLNFIFATASGWLPFSRLLTVAFF